MKPTRAVRYHDNESHLDVVVEIESRDTLFRYRARLELFGHVLDSSPVTADGPIVLHSKKDGIRFFIWDRPFDQMPAFEPFRLTPMMEVPLRG